MMAARAPGILGTIGAKYTLIDSANSLTCDVVVDFTMKALAGQSYRRGTVTHLSNLVNARGGWSLNTGQKRCEINQLLRMSLKARNTRNNCITKRLRRSLSCSSSSIASLSFGIAPDRRIRVVRSQHPRSTLRMALQLSRSFSASLQSCIAGGNRTSRERLRLAPAHQGLVAC